MTNEIKKLLQKNQGYLRIKTLTKELRISKDQVKLVKINPWESISQM